MSHVINYESIALLSLIASFRVNVGPKQLSSGVREMVLSLWLSGQIRQAFSQTVKPQASHQLAWSNYTASYLSTCHLCLQSDSERPCLYFYLHLSDHDWF